MTHQFDVDIAAEYGVNVAILFNNFAFWIAKNKANGNNYRNGTYWTHNSIKAFQELFPYMSRKQIENAIKKMLDEGLLIKDNFNENKHDRTLWYALTEKAFCILQNRRMDLPKKGNGVSPEGKCINTDINPDVNPDVNHIERFTPPTTREVHDYCKERDNNIDAEPCAIYCNTNNYSTKDPSSNIKGKHKAEIVEIIDYFNRKIGSHYRPDNEDTVNKLTKILGKYKYTAEDCKKAIDNMVSAWSGTEFEQYLRPSTIFNGKFESYLNWRAKPKQKEKQETNNDDVWNLDDMPSIV